MRRVLLAAVLMLTACDDFGALRESALCDAGKCGDGGATGGGTGGSGGGATGGGTGGSGGGATGGGAGGSGGGGTGGGTGGATGGGTGGSGGGATGGGTGGGATGGGTGGTGGGSDAGTGDGGVPSVRHFWTFPYAARTLAALPDRALLVGEAPNTFMTRALLRADGTSNTTYAQLGGRVATASFAWADAGIFVISASAAVTLPGVVMFTSESGLVSPTYDLFHLPTALNIYPELDGGFSSAIYGTGLGGSDLHVQSASLTGISTDTVFSCAANSSVVAHKIRYSTEGDGLLVGTLSGSCLGVDAGMPSLGQSAFAARVGNGTTAARFDSLVGKVVLDRTDAGMVAAWRRLGVPVAVQLGLFGTAGASLLNPPEQASIPGARDLAELVGFPGHFAVVGSARPTLDGGGQGASDLTINVFTTNFQQVGEFTLPMPGDQDPVAAAWLSDAGLLAVAGNCGVGSTQTWLCTDRSDAGSLPSSWVLFLDPAKF